MGRPARYDIDPKWLRDQVEAQGRTFCEIAEEHPDGISAQSIGVLARQFGIQAHERGGHTHRHPLAALGGEPAFPATVWAAFKGQGAIQRIQRFLIIERHSSLTRAAHAAGADQASLTQQLDKLETATGLHLLERAHGRRTPKYSDEGRELAVELRKTLRLLELPRSSPTVEHDSIPTGKDVTPEENDHAYFAATVMK